MNSNNYPGKIRALFNVAFTRQDIGVCPSPSKSAFNHQSDHPRSNKIPPYPKIPENYLEPSHQNHFEIRPRQSSPERATIKTETPEKSEYSIYETPLNKRYSFLEESPKLREHSESRMTQNIDLSPIYMHSRNSSLCEVEKGRPAFKEHKLSYDDRSFNIFDSHYSNNQFPEPEERCYCKFYRMWKSEQSEFRALEESHKRQLQIVSEDLERYKTLYFKSKYSNY